MTEFKLDRRTRQDSDRHFVTAEEFFAQEFQALAAMNGELVLAGMEKLNAPPLTLEIDGRHWTILRSGDRLVVREGGPASRQSIVVHLTRDQFSDWAQNQISLNGFSVMRTLSFRNGTIAEVSIWDSLWMALLEGWAVWDENLTFVDRRGAPLDLHARFTRDDDPEDIAHFLREAGYVIPMRAEADSRPGFTSC